MVAANRRRAPEPAATHSQVAHQLSGERLLPFAVAAREVPSRTGRPVNALTIWRWSAVGVKTPRGRIKLEAIRCGATWFTSAEAVARFIETLSGRSELVALPRTPARRATAAERAGKLLKAAGM